MEGNKRVSWQTKIPGDILKDLFVRTDRIKELPGVTRIILFGSYAKGTAGFSSDIDLAVFFDSQEYFLLDEYRQLVKICASPEIDFQVQAFNDRELADPCGIVEEILEYGVELFVREAA